MYKGKKKIKKYIFQQKKSIPHSRSANGKKWDENKIENLRWGEWAESRMFRKSLWGESYKLLLFKNKIENLWWLRRTDIQIIKPQKWYKSPLWGKEKKEKSRSFATPIFCTFLKPQSAITILICSYLFLWLICDFFKKK